MRAAPTTFHCAHCNTLLAVPTGAWACQVRRQNAAASGMDLEAIDLLGLLFVSIFRSFSA